VEIVPRTMMQLAKHRAVSGVAPGVPQEGQFVQITIKKKQIVQQRGVNGAKILTALQVGV